MPLPAILAVDDDQHVLAAVERDLKEHFARDYRVLTARSGAEGLEVAHKLKTRGELVALYLVDQRMPEMAGTDFLGRAADLYPEARKVLLTAYADTQAAITSINEVGLDYYLMKPWEPQVLFDVLEDLLADWLRSVPVPFEGIRVVGTLWSAGSHAVKDFLARNRVPYLWLDVEKDAGARALAEGAGVASRLPVVFFPDGTWLVEPDNRTLAERCGLQTAATRSFYPLIIVGAGPAGLAAAVYGASEGISLAVIERHATGGQAGTSALIENYLGFPRGLSGADLATRATAQARRFGAEIITAQEVTSIRVEDPYRVVTLGDGTELGCHALLLATGITVTRLDAPGVAALTGVGVYYGAAATEAASYRGAHVVVVGGANSAAQAALLFTRGGCRVTMVVRGPSFRMSRYLVDQIQASPVIEVLYNTEVIEALGGKRLEAVMVREAGSDVDRRLEAPAMFVFIGATPHSSLVEGLVDRDPEGFVLTGQQYVATGQRPRGWKLLRDPYLLETSVAGVFAAGDVRKDANRRVGSAVGDGGMAVSFIGQYLRSV